jgi:hypothetical protein
MVFSSTIVPILTAAGWYPDRRVSMSHPIPSSHPAAAVLSELGGIEVVPPSAEGVECATSRLRFQMLTPDVDSQMRPWSPSLNEYQNRGLRVGAPQRESEPRSLRSQARQDSFTTSPGLGSELQEQRVGLLRDHSTEGF